MCLGYGFRLFPYSQGMFGAGMVFMVFSHSGSNTITVN